MKALEMMITAMRKPITGIITVIILLIAVINCDYAAETGKIKGRILDATNNEPLVGAHVIVEGTDLGAATDANGEYLITNIRAGTYTLSVSYISYQSVTMTGVLVLLDQTFTADFKLKLAPIEMEPIIITAPKEIYTPNPSTYRPIDAKEYDRLPVYNLTDLVGLQAGVLQDDRRGWTHLRGGRFDDVAYFVDGVQAQDALYNTLWSSPRPTTDAIKEVIIITGGYDPEYGEAMSGVIQTLTKEGGEKVEGRLRAQSDAFFPRQDYNYGYTKLSVAFGGALPNLRRLRYFVSGERLHSEANSEIRYRVVSPRDEYTGEGKLTFKARNSTFTLDGHNSCYQWQGYSNRWRFWSEHNFANRVRSSKWNFHVNHMLTPVSIVTLKTGWFKTALMRTIRDKNLEAENEGNFFWKPYQFKGEDFVFGKDTIKDFYVIGKDTFWIPGEVIAPDPEERILKLYKLKQVVNGDTEDMFIQNEYWHNNPYGVYNLFVGKGDNRIWHFRSTENIYLKTDVTHNVRKIHELKAGFDIKRYALTELTNSLPWDPNPFWEAFTYNPITGAAYIQDRADFENLVVRGGFRLDYLDANVWRRLYPDSILITDTVKVNMKFRVSPRLGISFPITERIKFRFSYGHFFKNPTFSDMYQSLKALKEGDIIRRGNIIVGNPDLAAEKTIGYETGFDAQLSDYLGFDLTAFYKDVFDLIGTRPVPALPMSYTTFYNVEYGRILGFEIGFHKRLLDYWQANLSYTLQIAKGTAATSTDWYFRGGDPIQVDYYLDHDQRHTAAIDLGFYFPSDFVAIPLRNFNISTVSRFGTGLPYTPTDLKGNQIGDVNSARYPSSFTSDARLSKDFSFAGLQMNIALDITNLFNTLTVTNVSAVTGSPSNDGRIITQSEFRAGMVVGDLYYHPARDANHDGYLTQREEYEAYIKAYEEIQNSPSNYGPPRKIRLGINLAF